MSSLEGHASPRIGLTDYCAPGSNADEESEAYVSEDTEPEAPRRAGTRASGMKNRSKTKTKKRGTDARISTVHKLLREGLPQLPPEESKKYALKLVQHGFDCRAALVDTSVQHAPTQHVSTFFCEKLSLGPLVWGITP